MAGDVQIVKMSGDNDPEPWIYDATFASPYSSGGAMQPRRLTGDADVRALLESLAVADIDEFIRELRGESGRVVVRDIQLTQEELRRRGLL